MGKFKVLRLGRPKQKEADVKYVCKYCKDTLTIGGDVNIATEWEREHKECRKDYCSHGVYMGSRVKENGSINCEMCE